MNFITHIMISEMLHKYFSGHFALDKDAFRYGNVKPDLTSKCLRNPHTLENCLFLVSSGAIRLTNQSLSLKDFSTDLGVICHYICDFFCYYHLDNAHHKKLLLHFFYELRLQLALSHLMLSGKIRIKPVRIKLLTGFASMVLEMRREYASEKKSLNKDIEYAFHAAVGVCETIILKRDSDAAVMDHPA